ncbi:Integrase core domain protein [uncultured archaeon]|nr:Integrase core domain protein [uncultured archaeon]
MQSQVDWAECGRIDIDNASRKLYCFTMILGYSRMRYVEFTPYIDVHTLINCHLNAFHYFGGCTSEILYNNMKQIVLKRAPVSSNSQ